MALSRRAQDKFGRIGVLMGGPSAERKISLSSGAAVYQALIQLGLEAVAIDITTDSVKENIDLIRARQINCAFLALHGRFGEDGQIQEILETMQIPYTGSGVEASRLAMDKIKSRKIFETLGLAVPRYRVLDKLSRDNVLGIDKSMGLPLVVKPAGAGSSIGLSIIEQGKDLGEAIDLAFTYDERIILEEYITGREITAGILNDSVLPLIEIIPKKRFFDYEAKYSPGLTDYVVPARLEERLIRQVSEIGLEAHQALGCFGCSRVDMILNQENVAVVLEVNTIPGLTATSLLPKAAKHIGIEFGALCLALIKLAYGQK